MAWGSLGLIVPVGTASPLAGPLLRLREADVLAALWIEVEDFLDDDEDFLAEEE